MIPRTTNGSISPRRAPRLSKWLVFGFAILSTACTGTASPTPRLPPPTAHPVTSTLTPANTAAPAVTPTMIPTVAAAPTMPPAPTAKPTLVPQTEAVVLVVIDGARWTETLGDPDTAFVPHLAHDLAPLGAVNNAFYTEGATLSVPGHASLLTGVWQAIPNDGTVRPTTPTIFEYFRKATGASVDEAVFVHGSTIQPVLTYSTQPDYGEVFGARMYFSDEPEVPYDDGMWANAREVIATLHPRLLVISLLDPDESAHLGQWEAYRAAIRHDDEIIWRLWQQLQGDAFYAGHTTLMVTNDHGRGCGAGWPNHGGDDDCNRHIMFLAVGPEILAGQVLTQRRTLIDIAPTIGRLLNFDTPLAEGEVMQELFEKATPTPVAYSPPAPGAGHSITVGRALSGTCP